MIPLVAASVVYLAAFQATIDAPRQAFWACAKVQKSKAMDEKVAGDSYEAYLRKACSSELGSLQAAIAAVDIKNGMTRKAADSDAASSINDYVSDPVDNYKTDFAAMSPPKPAAAQAQPAAAPAQPAPATKAAAASSQPHI